MNLSLRCYERGDEIKKGIKVLNWVVASQKFDFRYLLWRAEFILLENDSKEFNERIIEDLQIIYDLEKDIKKKLKIMLEKNEEKRSKKRIKAIKLIYKYIFPK